MYHSLYRLLAKVDRERVHRFGLKAAALAYDVARLPPIGWNLPLMPVEVMGLRFPNPVGLAAGMDRTGELYTHLGPSGFGFMEMGTINHSLHRNPLTSIGAIRDRRDSSRNHPDLRPLLGISLGSLHDRLDARTRDEYLQSMEALRAHADYIALNLSRPGSAVRSGDTTKQQMAEFLVSMVQAHQEEGSKQDRPVPLVVKAAIREDEVQTIPLLLHLGKEAGLDGFVAAFEQWKSTDEMLHRIERIARFLEPIPLIVVGGIRSAEDARLRFMAGAALVQLYGAFLDCGPFVARRIVNGLLAMPPPKGSRVVAKERADDPTCVSNRQRRSTSHTRRA
ncbi:MAG: hypothetical protein GY696_03035 [Gammaproteobacteria bacterium]|nr:hypothetical protein [Gammaproteobacteria bacterium]